MKYILKIYWKRLETVLNCFHCKGATNIFESLSIGLRRRHTTHIYLSVTVCWAHSKQNTMLQTSHNTWSSLRTLQVLQRTCVSTYVFQRFISSTRIGTKNGTSPRYSLQSFCWPAYLKAHMCTRSGPQWYVSIYSHIENMHTPTVILKRMH